MKKMLSVGILLGTLGCGSSVPCTPDPRTPAILKTENKVVQGYRVSTDADTIWAPSHGKTLYYLMMDEPRGPIDPKYRGHRVTANGRVFRDEGNTKTFLLVRTIVIED